MRGVPGPRNNLPPDRRNYQWGRFHLEVRMRGISKAEAGDKMTQNFLFTWKEKYWRLLRQRVETFRMTGKTQERWNCAAHKKIHPGDRAYMLKQGRPIGIFGRGTVIGTPFLSEENSWQVLISFEVSRGDVLSNPEDNILVAESDLRKLPVPEKQWQNQSSGIRLEPNAARGIDRAIDSMILGSILIGRGQNTLADEAIQEVVRRKKLIEQRVRPEQQRFSETIRSNYQNKCAVTGCVTPAALEAAHISTKKDTDNNSPANGILLRSDIHLLFDRFLITLSEDGTRIEVKPELADPGYTALKTAVVARPENGPPPSAQNIRDHRNRFFEAQRHEEKN